MKNYLKKLLALFKTPDPKKPVEYWPFPVVSEDFEPRKECCGKCDKPTTKKPAKKVAAKGVVAAKKTAKKKAAK